MGDFDYIADAALVPGKTVPYKFTQFIGEPVVHVEHLGETNKTYLNEEIARANSSAALASSGGGKRVSKQLIKEQRDKRRKIYAKHAVRKLEAKTKTGEAAGQDLIPDFVNSLPDEVFDVAWNFVRDPENFRELTIDADEDSTKALVEK
jgi:hypothetical protein